jgi:hypothetical protein
MTDAFTRTHAATIRKLVIGLEGRAVIEVGIRTGADGKDTADSTAWPEDVDLQDMCKLHDLPKSYPLMLTEGTTLDLYVATMQDHGEYGLKCNYDARYVGGVWRIIDQHWNERVA